MRNMLDHYVRSLKEREEDPERHQDLGTLVTWILEQHGYEVISRPYKHKIEKLGVSKGRLQHGIDILAVKEESGKVESYRFVLKEGPFGKAQFDPSTEGTMLHDLELAASVDPKERELRYGFEPGSIKVIAVHNGTIDRDQIGSNLDRFLSGLPTRYPSVPLATEWWDADKLVALIQTARPAGGASSLDPEVDTSLFPPSARPFFSLALHSLLPERGKAGAGFDHSAIDLLLDQRLPLGDLSAALREDEIHRAIAELSLFAHMIRIECDHVADGTTLPVFDTIERVLCRATEHVRRLPGKPSKGIREGLDGLLHLYVETAKRLVDRLAPVLELPYGLAFPAPGEVVSYPLRALRMSSYLATAGLALVLAPEQPKQTKAQVHARRDEARRIAASLVTLWDHNQGGCLSPVTDDQIIDISLAWELWLRLDMTEPVARFAAALIERLALRKAAGLPLPSLWHRARVPMRSEDLKVIVEVHARGRKDAPSGFTDDGSTILPLAVYLAVRLGKVLDPSWLDAFWPAKSASSDRAWAVFPQSWQPPPDAAKEWYVKGIEHSGTCKVFEIGKDVDAFVTDFETFNQPILKTTAEAMGRPVVDRIAWKLWRTPAPMAVFVELAAAPSKI